MLIRLTSTGDVLIEEIVRRRFNELVSGQPVLVKALNRIITVASGGSAMTTRYKTDKRALRGE